MGYCKLVGIDTSCSKDESDRILSVNVNTDSDVIKKIMDVPKDGC